ncbi:Periplasmic [NiFe] hydrogenase large subunit [Methanimicrococcus sp. At1]|uniref:Periplasmic [NiFe] hydrogenase large subunit n=1 Tax=Methanimicrococcus hacksteinii TaxID=3028293 RepID=A0ABU3VMU5_9EURY|nr:nickel-dependent hydrogenase large subunit [Methanimicrococcus sp. At1]MDV0444686.1 Periplasmic [NiFe] hydrogenase large subunit [Methanimicrococcus sp. At1]
MVKVTVDPLTRIEGHMRVSAEVDSNGIITSAQSGGMLFRGFERMLQNKDPRDASLHVARICGVCPISHSMTATNALDDLYQVAESVPKNALAVRNFIQAANTVASHATHIYILFGPDLANPRYRDVLTGSTLNLGATGEAVWKELVGRFAPLSYKIDGQPVPVGTSYLNAIPEKKRLQEAIALFGGKMPHQAVTVAGGVTCTPDLGEISKAAAIYLKVMEFVQNYTLGVDLDTWVENTHYAKSPDAAVKFVIDHLSGLIDKSKDFSRESGWKDVEFYAAFGSELVGEKLLGLPASLRHDKLGGYSDASKMCFLSYGEFYDSTKEGYTPSSPTGERFLTSGIVRASNLKFEDLDTAKISESIQCAFYEDDTPSRHPYDGTTVPLSDTNKIDLNAGPTDKYSWLKAPRYDGIAAEVGPLARMIVAQDPLVTGLAKAFADNGMSPANVYTRVLARMQETAVIAHKIVDFLNDIDPGQSFATPLDMRAAKDNQGMGIWEAPRGALGHWISADGSGKTKNYQAIVPSTWNLGPRDENGIPSPIEQALVGNAISGVDNVGGADYTNPVAILHVGRSYDPCIACAVHTIDATGKNAPKDYELF